MKQLFATNRLEICELTEKDKIFFVELLSNPEIINPIPQPKWSYTEIEEKFEDFRNYAINPLEKEKVLWGVYEKGTDELIT
jgi:[ribosomal protein S5]-alanine N-acetyltransferase